jgi:transcription antitermination protein NusB
MQSLFEWDFNSKSTELDSILSHNIEQFGPGMEDAEFATNLAHGVVEHLDEINTIITETAPEWPLDQITTVDRNVLRLGIYELMFLKDVPPKVAINEAVEIGKAFGGENSGKFINGVLGTLYKKVSTESGEVSESESEAVEV